MAPAVASVDKSAEANVLAAGDANGGALESLWKTRTASSVNDSDADFALGPGDVLRISLPQIDQIKDRTVRVSEEDTVALPLLGVINVTGMTEEDFRNDLSSRVGKYFYHPQVGVFLEHTENRQVAVLGSVKAPGRYRLAGHSDRIITMIGRAGGLTEGAASRILLIPAPSKVNPGAALPVAEESQSFVSVSMSRVGIADMPSNHAGPEGWVIDLSRSDNQRYLELPARAGDVIIVPEAGEVTVQGWVDKPGPFKITPGMSVLSAIAAAGGALFTSSATLLRPQGNGIKHQFPLDLAKIKSGAEADMAVQSGDVVVVERSVAGAVPYSAYFLINKLGLGFAMPVL